MKLSIFLVVEGSQGYLVSLRRAALSGQGYGGSGTGTPLAGGACMSYLLVIMC